jgi:pimeloyl-ACP methyl ester carboxylesterase
VLLPRILISLAIPSTTASNFIDIVNHCNTITIRGLINVGGLPYLDTTILTHILNPNSLAIFAGLSQSTDSDAFKNSRLQLASWLSDYLTPDMNRTLLDGMALVPKDLAVRLTRRTQDPTKMLRLGREGKLNLAVIVGERDKFFMAGGVKKVFEELDWRNLEFKTIEGADHMAWISRPNEFRDNVLTWIERCK